MRKVSIIIPVYNAEKYLSECINSIIYQSYNNLEIILVNDGSTDNSIYICRQYANKDNRIIVIDSDNYGVSYARNIGIERATGKYIVFIDSDDMIEKDYIGILVTEMEEKNLDMVVCGYKDINIVSNVKKNMVIKNDNRRLLTGFFSKDYYIIRNFLNGPCFKLYRLEFIKKNKIKFPDNVQMAEDQMFNYKYYLYVKKYRFINKPLYLYIHRENISLTKIKNYDTFLCDLLNFKLKKEYLEQMNIKERKKILSEWAVLLVNKYVFLDGEDNNYRDFKNRVHQIKKIFSSTIIWNTGLKKILAVICFKYNIFLPFYLKQKINFIRKEKYRV